ncbi:tRNA(Met) cytidine acetyltransferase TmcA domain-containing protein, partial [Idiomarina sp.]|uniref:tRNA(Met) cytidine acetyltransferase TmcA domain-containing protein n=1 Tax=Idiomarina sp. TaxID=1874361 RepID=UPI0025870288
MVLKHTGFRQLHIISDGALLSPSFETCPNNLSLYLSDSDTAAHAATNRYRDFLGHEFNQVVIDCRNQLNFDAIAALCGTLMAGGELVLLTPQQPSPALNRLIDCWQMRSPIEATSDAKPPSLPTAA